MKRFLLAALAALSISMATAQPSLPPLTTGKITARGPVYADSSIVFRQTFDWARIGSFYIQGDTLQAHGSSIDSLKFAVKRPTIGQIPIANGTGTYVPGDPTSLGGLGTVTSVSAGNLSPLFTTSVSNPTTTPAISFSLSNAGSRTFFGNNAGGAGAPSYLAQWNWLINGGSFTYDSIRFANNTFVTFLQTGNALTIQVDRATRADTLVNQLQYVWKRTSGGMADLVNPADTVFVGSNTGYNAFLPTGKLNFNQKNGSGTYSIVFGGDSSASLDAGYMIGRMNDNKRWLKRHLGASDILQEAIVNSGGGLDMYYAMKAAGMGISVIPVNRFDVAGNMSVTGGTVPSMTGGANLFVLNNFSAGFSQNAAANLSPHHIALGVPLDQDGIYTGVTYSTSAANEKFVDRFEGITTTPDATPVNKVIHSMNAVSDSTACIMIEVNIVTYLSGGGTPANRGQASYKLIGTFGYENSAVLQIGSTSVPHFAESNASLACTLSASGNDIILTYTGIAGENWRWYAYSRRYYAGHTNQ